MDVQKHLHILKNKEIDELYVNIGLRAFALALVSVFIPIFLLDLGFNLTHFGFYGVWIFSKRICSCLANFSFF